MGKSLFIPLIVMLFQPTLARAECRPVADNPAIKIAPDVQKTLDEMKITRQLAFSILHRTSIPETNGCWAGATGSFDNQYLSVGAMQWNFGQQSLQFVLYQYRKSFLTQAAFDAEVARLMPNHGKLLFSDGCRHGPISAGCKRSIMALQGNGRLSPSFAQEVNALFESDPMIQVQFDRFLSTVTSLRSDLVRLFGDGRPTELRVKWALDTKTQQGSFPKDVHIRAMRRTIAGLTMAGRHANLLGMVSYYNGLCSMPISEGIRHDCAYNVTAWTRAINALYSPRLAADEAEKLDLSNLSWLRALEAQGKGGAYQALSLQRRITIVLGTGSVAGRRW